MTDALRQTTRYGYDAQTGVLHWVQAPLDTSATRTNYTYDAMFRLTGVTKAVSGLSGGAAQVENSYTYENDRIKTITHSNTPDASTTYTFLYTAFAQVAGVKVGSRDRRFKLLQHRRSNLHAFAVRLRQRGSRLLRLRRSGSPDLQAVPRRTRRRASSTPMTTRTISAASRTRA